ncbi:MAG TPA: hypothetical protein VF754_10205, partial [Pyrinomonadaceae bacterium]
GAALLIVMGAILAGVAIPAYKSKVVATNESAALSHLGEIAAQQHIYLTSTGSYAGFRQLVAAGLLDAKFEADAPVISGYVFTLKVTPGTESTTPFFSVNADPAKAEGFTPTGKRHFYLDSETAGIRYHEERPATAADRAR